MKILRKAMAVSLCAAMAAPYGIIADAADTRTVNAYVNTFEDKQTILGVGGGITWYNTWLTESPAKQQVYDLLFKEVGLDLIRIKNFYYDGQFSGETDKEIIEAAEKAAGKELPILMSSWSPGKEVKSNGVEAGGGTIKRNDKGEYAYDEYAQYYVDMLKAYRDAGVKIDYFSIQNEPDFRADYDGCELDAEENADHAQYSKAFEAVYEAFKNVDNPPKLVGPDSMTASYTNIKKFVQPVIDRGDGALYAIAHHLYAGGNEENPDQYKKSMNKLRDNYPDIPKWQTEYYRGNGVQTAWLMTNVFVEEGAEAYFYWDTVWGPDGTLVALENPWEPKSTWKSKEGYTVDDKIYAIEHFAQFTDGGYVRVDSSVDPDANDIKLAAFNSPNKDKLTLILTNTKDTDANVKLNLNGYDVTSSHVYRTDYREGGKERMADLGALSADATVSLPAQCIVTVDITGKQGEKPAEILKAAEAEPQKSEETTAVYGTPVIDGEADETWQAVPAVKMMNTAHGDHGASGEFKTMWDEKNLYVLVDVTDENLDDSAENPYEQDSVEIFLNERGDKPDAYDKGDAQYRVNYKNVHSYGTGADEAGFKTGVKLTDKGYTVEAAVPINVITPKAGVKMGLDVQINDSHGNGQRDYILKWSDPTDNTWGNLEDIGTVELTAADEDDDSIKVIVNGNKVAFTDQEPVIVNDRTLIPVRAVSEALGKNVDWNGETQTVIITDEGAEAAEISEVNDGKIKVYANGVKVTFTDQEPIIMNDRTMIPLRAVSEALGKKVDWNGETKTVTIN